MAKLISSIQYSYENAKGRTVKGIVLARDSQYPFKLWTQQCLRLSLFLGRYGVESAQVLQAFIDGNPIPASDTIGYSTYQEHPLIQLKADRNDKRPLQFGKNNAKLLVACLGAHSLGDLQATLADVIGEAKASDTAPPHKGKGKGKPQGGKGGGKPRVEVQERDADEVEEAQVMARVASHDPSLEDQIAHLEGIIAEVFNTLPKLQGKLRGLYAQRGATVTA